LLQFGYGADDFHITDDYALFDFGATYSGTSGFISWV
jgi:hypothetical protein